MGDIVPCIADASGSASTLCPNQVLGAIWLEPACLPKLIGPPFCSRIVNRPSQNGNGHGYLASGPNVLRRPPDVAISVPRSEAVDGFLD